MRFQVGDTVFHPVHGVGHIVAVAEKQFVGEKVSLYYEITTEKSTVWVPVEAHVAIGLRRVTVKGDLARYRTLLKSRPASLVDDHGKRHLHIAGCLKEGSLQLVCEVVRDLTSRAWRKPLTQADTVALRKAREELHQEWATADGVSIAEAAREVDALLLKARQAYSPAGG